MELLKKFTNSHLVIRNISTLVAVLVLFGLSYFFNYKHNEGESSVYLWLARISIVVGCILCVTWFF